MQRRTFLSRSILTTSLAIFTDATRAARSIAATAPPLPRRERIRVAFMLGERSNVIDTAGPWEVFQDVMLHDSKPAHPFDMFTVGPADGKIVTMTGGLRVQPHYTIETAPQPNVIVVPAQKATDESRAWLSKAAAGTDVTMSVCTGAFQLARAGLLDGLAATTHHDFWDAFSREFPKVELKRGLRFVDNGRIATAGGLTSGIDMALHVVSRYLGNDVAAATAKYMEYSSEAWRTTDRHENPALVGSEGPRSP